MRREALRVGLPQGVTITRYHHQDAPALAQEVLDQDGAYALWSVLHSSGDGEHHYVARDQDGKIHGLLTGSEDGPNHFMHDLRTSQNAPAGVGAAMVQAAAKDALAGNRKLRAMGVMDSARHWWEAMGLKMREGDENGEFTPDTLNALLAGNTTELPNTKVYKNTPMGKYPVPVDPDVKPWLDPARRAPGSARALQVAASVLREAQRLLGGNEDELRDVYQLQKDDTQILPADTPTEPIHQPAREILKEFLQQNKRRNRRDITLKCPECGGFKYVPTARGHKDCPTCDGRGKLVKPEIDQKLRPWAERLENALYDEFMEWWPTSEASRTRTPQTSNTKWESHPSEPVTHWLNVEDFLKERYPEAATGSKYGGEYAGPRLEQILIDDKAGTPPPDWLEANGYVGHGNAVTQAMLTLHNRYNRRYWRSNDDRRRYYELMLRHIGPKAPKPRKAASILDAVEAIRLAQQVLGAKTQNGIMADETIERLRGEFSDWWDQQDHGNYTPNSAQDAAHYWSNVESFLKDRYPAAHRGLDYGYEQARPLLKQKNDREWGDVPDADPYDATPEEIAKYGYDPAEIAAGMLYLHNDSRSGRQSFQNADRNLLMKVIRTRHKMQQEYDAKPRQLELPLDLEKAAAAIREAQQILAMPAPAPKGLRFEHDPNWVHPNAPADHAKYLGRVQAFVGDEPVGYIDWLKKGNPLTLVTDRKPGEVNYIFVNDDQRHQNIATEMFDWTKKHAEPNLHHSPRQTDMGKAWAAYEQSRELQKAAAAIKHAQQVLAWKVDPNYFAAIHEMGHVLDAVAGFKASDTLDEALWPVYEAETGEKMSDEPGGHWMRYKDWQRKNLPGRGWEPRVDMYGMPQGFDDFNPKEALAASFVEHELNPDASTPAMRALHQHLIDHSVKANRPTNLTTFRPRAKPPKDIDPEDGAWPTGKLPRAFMDGIQYVFQKYPQSRIVDRVDPLEMSKGGKSPVTNTVLKTLESKPRIEYDDRAALTPKLVDDLFHREREQKNIAPWMYEDEVLAKAAAAIRLAVPLWQKIPTDLTFLEPNQESGEDPKYDAREWEGADGTQFSKLRDMAEEKLTGKWYHTSDHPLKPGDKIVPGGGEPSDPDFYEIRDYDEDQTGLPPYNNTNRMNHVWLSPNLDTATRWQRGLVTKYLYEVKPGDKPQRWNFDGTNGWVAPHAWVVKALSPEEVKRLNPPKKPTYSEIFNTIQELSPWKVENQAERVIPPRAVREEQMQEAARRLKEKYPGYDMPRGGIFDTVTMYEHLDPPEDDPLAKAAAVLRYAMPMVDAYDNQWPESPDIPRNKRDTIKKLPDDIPIYPGPWFHATGNDKLEPGTILVPNFRERNLSEGIRNRTDWTWMSDHPLKARLNGHYVYEVEPMDEGPFPWNGEPGIQRGHYVSPRARIVRQLGTDELRKMVQEDTEEAFDGTEKNPGADFYRDLLKEATAVLKIAEPLVDAYDPLNEPTLLHRGVGFQKGDMPPELEQRFEQAAAGQTDPNFIKDLLLHLDRDGGGMGEFWAHGKEGPWLAQTYSARVWPDKWTNLPSHYRVLLDADWDGSESDVNYDTDPDYRKLLPGAKVRVRNIKIRTPKHDWIDLGGEPEGSVRYAMPNANRPRMPHLYDWKPPVDEDGLVTLYHRTFPQYADSIIADQRFRPGKKYEIAQALEDDKFEKEHGFRPHHNPSRWTVEDFDDDEIWFATHPSGIPGYTLGDKTYEQHYGPAVVKVRVPPEKVYFMGVGLDHKPGDVVHAIMFPEDLKGVPIERHASVRHAAVNQDLLNRLHGEFKDWWGKEGPAHVEQTIATSGWPQDTLKNFADRAISERGPVGFWPNVEGFLKSRYPAAHRNMFMGYEDTRPLLDWKKNYDHDAGIPLYETGPEAEAKHGYDPREVVAAMLLLHNQSDPRRNQLNADLAKEDEDRLNEIAQKRVQMQRKFEQRQQETLADASTALREAQQILKMRTNA